MTGSNVCRLCRIYSSDRLRLCNANGNTNEIYSLTIKYFNPAILEIGCENESSMAVLCMQCWHNISGFNNFQQTIELLHANRVRTTEIDVTSDGQTQPVATSNQNNDFLGQIEITKKEPNTDPEFVTITDDDGGNSNLTTGPAGLVPSSENAGNISLQNTNNAMDFGDEFLEQESGQFFVINELNDDFDYLNCSGDEVLEERCSPHSNDTDNNNISVPASRKDPKYRAEVDAVIAKWRPLLKCEFCPLSFSTFNLLKTHFRAEHPNEEFYILCCGRKLKYRYRAEEHAILHLNPKALQCRLCDKCFSTRFTLVAHITKEHPGAELNVGENKDDSFKCSICGLCCGDQATLREHCNIHAKAKRHRCQFCQRSFKKEIALTKHVSRSHLDKKKVDYGYKKCPLCPKMFNYRTGIYHHLRNNHPEEFAKRIKRRHPKETKTNQST
ncbi:uncharacterized protein [Musca autumnalis]|uniref:uncharacterized protein n=1 Tax=Musca autumnalis TaxID=221902 RepID=UPI003CEAA695